MAASRSAHEWETAATQFPRSEIEPFRCDVEPTRAAAQVRPVGELDHATVPIVDAELADLWAVGFPSLVLDLREVCFPTRQACAFLCPGLLRAGRCVRLLDVRLTERHQPQRSQRKTLISPRRTVAVHRSPLQTPCSVSEAIVFTGAHKTPARDEHRAHRRRSSHVGSAGECGSADAVVRHDKRGSA
jgi:hypothetical protein